MCVKRTLQRLPPKRYIPTMSWIFLAVVIAQLACIIDMLMHGRTLRLPVAGGSATQINKNESPVAFHFILVGWLALFAFIDFLIWGRS